MSWQYKVGSGSDVVVEVVDTTPSVPSLNFINIWNGQIFLTDYLGAVNFFDRPFGNDHLFHRPFGSGQLFYKPFPQKASKRPQRDYSFSIRGCYAGIYLANEIINSPLPPPPNSSVPFLLKKIQCPLYL